VSLLGLSALMIPFNILAQTSIPRKVPFYSSFAKFANGTGETSIP
jgi:hypothetical protein